MGKIVPVAPKVRVGGITSVSVGLLVTLGKITGVPVFVETGKLVGVEELVGVGVLMIA